MTDKPDALEELRKAAKFLPADSMNETDIERIDAAIAAWEKERADAGDSDRLIARQSELLTSAANAIRGEPPPLTLWSHHDIAERIAALCAAVEKVRDKARKDAQEADHGSWAECVLNNLADALDAALRGGE